MGGGRGTYRQPRCHAPRLPNRHERRGTERFNPFAYKELAARDEASLDIFRLKDESPEDSANLPAPEILAREIAESLEAALCRSPAA